MANDITIDNGGLTDYIASTKELTGSKHVIGVELVTAVSAGARTDLAKAEDAAHATGDYGLMALAVRTDSASARATTDGDYIPLIVDSLGRLHVNAGSVPAAARTTDSVAASQSVDKLMNNLTEVAPVRASIAASSSGNNTLVAAQGSGNKILVHQIALVAASAVTVQLQSGASGTNLSGAMALAANGGFVLPFSPVGWCITAANTLLNLSLGGAVSVAGTLTYTVVT